jgi:hypothetical protein
MQAAQQRQKHIADTKRRPLEFAVGDKQSVPQHYQHQTEVQGYTQISAQVARSL